MTRNKPCFCPEMNRNDLIGSGRWEIGGRNGWREGDVKVVSSQDTGKGGTLLSFKQMWAMKKRTDEAMKGIERYYGMCIIWMPGFLFALRKGAVFIGGDKTVRFSMGGG